MELSDILMRNPILYSRPVRPYTWRELLVK